MREKIPRPVFNPGLKYVRCGVGLKFLRRPTSFSTVAFLGGCGDSKARITADRRSQRKTDAVLIFLYVSGFRLLLSDMRQDLSPSLFGGDK
jgi:hypothetical protein